MSSAGVARKQNQLRILLSNFFNSIENVENKEIENELKEVLEVESKTGGTKNIQELEGRMNRVGITETEKSKMSKGKKVADRAPKIKKAVMQENVRAEIDIKKEEKDKQDQLEI